MSRLCQTMPDYVRLCPTLCLKVWRSCDIQQRDSAPLLRQVSLNNNINKQSCLHCHSHYQGIRISNINDIKTYLFFSILQIRVILLRTDLLPYDDVADLFIIDPDGFIIRKWNSKQLNNGLMTADFQVRRSKACQVKTKGSDL